MNRSTKPAASATELRRRAIARLRKRKSQPNSTHDMRRLVHELQVHQVELEMQNGELQEARDQMELVVEKYTDLYDYAPVGYFSLDERGRILELNLTGASLLGLERSRLINRRFQQCVLPESRPDFAGFLKKLFAGTGRQVCEVTLLNEDGAAFPAEVHAVWADSLQETGKWCRVTVADVSERKRAEAAQRRAEALAATNQELGREIVRRQAGEEALRQREHHQAGLLVESRQMQDQLRLLSHRILEAQEAERKRISRELHDEITQVLVGISVHLAALAQEAAINPSRLRQRIARTQRQVEKLVNIVHDFARELRPTGLDDLGLIAALQNFLTEFRRRTRLRVHFTTFAGVDQLHADDRTVLFRVILSALSNVARHAHASRVKVSIRKVADTVHLEISDNGKSFDVERVLNVTKNRRLGVLGMRERVEMVGGRFSVESAPGRGTKVRAAIPFRSSPADQGR
jgi:PAS domain S-box-containing protein